MWVTKLAHTVVLQWAISMIERFSDISNISPVTWWSCSSLTVIGVRRYEKESSRGDQQNTSRISPYLHFGQISPRTVLSEGRFMKSPKFLRKLAWRDLSYWLLSIFPDLPYEPTRPQYVVSRQTRLGVALGITIIISCQPYVSIFMPLNKIIYYDTYFQQCFRYIMVFLHWWFVMIANFKSN